MKKNDWSRKSVFICTTRRSGSTLLCEYLGSHKKLPIGLEYFWRKQRRSNSTKWGTTSLKDYVEKLLQDETSKDGYFVSKAFMEERSHLDFIAELREVFFLQGYPVSRLLHTLFGETYHILLYREDIHAQALSYEIAMDTGQWLLRGGEDKIETERQKIDPARISDRINRIIEERELWRGYFVSSGVSYHEVSYENLCEHPDAVCDRIAEYLRIEKPIEWVAPNLLKQN